MSLCLDGNTACANLVYRLIDAAAIYPITPSSTMADLIEQYSATQRRNIFGNVVSVSQTHSELGAAAMVHGLSKAGSLAATFTSSQGLLLMIPNLNFLAGSHQPAVIHLASRSVGFGATSLAPDHTDLYQVSQTNMCAVISRNVQETQDCALAAHLAAIESSAAFIHCFEGFRVSHQFETFSEVSDEVVKSLVDNNAIQRFKNAQMDPNNPNGRGIGLGGEMYYAAHEAQKFHFDKVAAVVVSVFDKIHKAVGRKYELFEYVGHPEAETVIVCMGASSLTIEATVEELMKTQKVGYINVRLWRPFDAKYFLSKLPATVKNLAILDRARDFVANGELLYKEVVSVCDLYDKVFKTKAFTYGICGTEILPDEVLAIYDSFTKQTPKVMRVGITGVGSEYLVPTATNLSERISGGFKQSIVWALGSDGTIGAIRNAMKILQDQKPNAQVQANFEFDGKKSGGMTISYLRFGERQIKLQYNPTDAEYVAVHTQSYIYRYDVLAGIRQNGTFVLNCDFPDVERSVPARLKRAMAAKGIRFYVVNAGKIASALGLGNKTSMILVIFLMSLGMSGMLELETAVENLKALARITYAKQAQAIIDANMKAVDVALEELPKCEYKFDTKQWLAAKDSDDEQKPTYGPPKDDLITTGIFGKVVSRDFRSITVEDAIPFASGVYPPGYAKYEKPMNAEKVAHCNHDQCIQCNTCAAACPHGVIRPFTVDGKITIQVSPLDCRGCQVCEQACPKKCISMEPVEQEVKTQQEIFDKLQALPAPAVDTAKCNLKELQMGNQYFFNPGSCPGCPETSITRMLTALFGDHLVISSAVGCCLVWGHYNQLRPYQVDQNGRGPSVGTSAFEDNALFGLGLTVSNITNRNNLLEFVKKNTESISDESLKALLSNWVQSFNDAAQSAAASQALIKFCEAHETEFCSKIVTQKPFLMKRSHWMIGGDGWSYDIDFGGLDHVMSSGVNVNVLVFNNGGFSNTGGQYSKATFQSAIMKHATLGVQFGHKKMSEMFTVYRRAYIAQIAPGANRGHALKVLREAEAFNGPSLVVCYCPCISHNVVGGLKNSEKQQKLAVETGLWPLFRFDPQVGKVVVDSSSSKKVDEFTQNEQRFETLKKKDPERFAVLHAALQEDVDANVAWLKKMAE